MDKQKFISNSELFVKEKMSDKNIDIHGYRHVERVRKWAQIIGEKEGIADLFLLDVAMLLHDVGRSREEEIGEDGNQLGHYKAGEKIAREYLYENRFFPEEKIEKIILIVRNHGSGGDDIYLRVAQDADRMDLIGAVGLARSFTFLCDKPFYRDDTSFAPKNREDIMKKVDWNSKIRPWHLSAVDDVIFNLSISEKMNTVTAKKLVQEKIEFTKKFLEQLKKETILL